jgi:N4-gp56 family major capsid protein
MKTLSRFRFDLGRHDLRGVLPAALQPIVQNGILDRIFRDALLPKFLYPATASVEPVAQGIGANVTFTRDGLLPVATTPTTGSDPTPATLTYEQWSLSMEQYSNTMDTNRLSARASLADTFVRNVQKLGINAGQTLNQLARNKLYAAYGGGRSWVVTPQGSASTTCVVKSAAGFDTVLVNGVPTAVSAGNPLNVTINSVANTVVGCNLATNTLTLGTAVTQAVGDAAVASSAPYSLRPGSGATRYNLTGSNVLTAANVEDAVARLRTMNVPDINGNYVEPVHRHLPGRRLGPQHRSSDHCRWRQLGEPHGAPPDLHGRGRADGRPL